MKSPSKSSNSARPAPRRGMIAMETFAHRNGSTGKAINAFRKRKEKKRNETAKTLRQYRKVMKREGYEPGVGASRKRSRQHDEDGDDDEKQNEGERGEEEEEQLSSSKEQQDDQQQQQHKKKRKTKSNPFAKSMKQAQQHKLNVKERDLDKKQQEKQRQKRLIVRQKTTRKLSKRTKKGQPIMKHMVDNLLVKLKSQQSQQNQQK